MTNDYMTKLLRSDIT